MSSFNWSVVDKAVNKKRVVYEFDEVKHLFKKVAFDVYKPVTGSDQLWELRDGDDGKKYLFALYEEGQDIVAEASAKEWYATPDSQGLNITLSYKQIPVARFASAECGFTPEEAGEFAAFIEKKATNKDFVREMLKHLPEAKRIALIRLMGDKGE
jgi:hypothetical protein